MQFYPHDFVFITFRFVGPEDTAWYTKTIVRVVSEEYGEDVGQMVEPTHYFVDFMR